MLAVFSDACEGSEKWRLAWGLATEWHRVIILVVFGLFFALPVLAVDRQSSGVTMRSASFAGWLFAPFAVGAAGGALEVLGGLRIMRTTNRIGPVAFAAVLAFGVLLVSHSVAADNGVADDLASTQRAIAEAESDLARYAGGLIRSVIELRLQTLKSTEALLLQKQTADKTGASFNYTLPATKPDDAKASELLQDLVTAKQKLAELQAEADRYEGGLIQSMALINVATQRQTITMLEQAYFIAHYGLSISIAVLPPSSQEKLESGNEDLSETQQDPAGTTDVTSPSALREHVKFMAAGLVERGMQAEALGYFIIDYDTSELDDSPAVTAMLDSVERAIGFDSEKVLYIECFEGEARVLVSTNTYWYTRSDSYQVQVTYRIDDESGVDDRWSVSSNRQFVGRYGMDAIEFLDKLKGHQKLFVQISSEDDQARALFQLDGLDDTLERMGAKCGWSGLNASKAEREAGQQALKSLGFYTGSIDGAWGSGSRKAMIDYQKSQGLEPTGLLDDQTRKSLGF